jgi:hypothetical protein
MIVLFTLIAVGVHAKTLQLEHMYFDVSQTYDYYGVIARADQPGSVIDANGDVVTPVTAKGKCKGAGCPPFHGTPIAIDGCAWESLSERTVYIEETAGWFLFWLDDKFTKPLLPHPNDLKTYTGEQGYLSEKAAGRLVYR